MRSRLWVFPNTFFFNCKSKIFQKYLCGVLNDEAQEIWDASVDSRPFGSTRVAPWYYTNMDPIVLQGPSGVTFYVKTKMKWIKTKSTTKIITLASIATLFSGTNVCGENIFIRINFLASFIGHGRNNNVLKNVWESAGSPFKCAPSSKVSWSLRCDDKVWSWHCCRLNAIAVYQWLAESKNDNVIFQSPIIISRIFNDLTNADWSSSCIVCFSSKNAEKGIGASTVDG